MCAHYLIIVFLLWNIDFLLWNIYPISEIFLEPLHCKRSFLIRAIVSRLMRTGFSEIQGEWCISYCFPILRWQESTGRKEWIKRERKDNGIRKRIDICCGLAMQKKKKGVWWKWGRGVIEMLKRMIIISIYRLTIMFCSFSVGKKSASQYSYM